MGNSKEIEFIGIPSGDYECFCWDVDAENYKKVVGREPDEFDYDNVDFVGDQIIVRNDSILRLYPDHIFSNKHISEDGSYTEVSKVKSKCRIKIIYEDLE